LIVYIMRHGQIEFGRRGLPKVEERHITPRGAEWVRRSVSFAHRDLSLSPDRIFSSPLVRARESAELAKKALGFKKEVTTVDWLLGEGNVEVVYRALRKFDKSESVLMVSHFPLIGKLIDDLLGRETNLAMFSGGIAAFQCDSYPRHGKGTLIWLLPPGMFFDGKKWMT
jgi:phosphohistidine phosphatase